MDYAVSFFMLGEVARLTVAVIFASAALHAMLEWMRFGGIVEQYRIVPDRLAWMIARTVPPLLPSPRLLTPVPATRKRFPGASGGLGRPTGSGVLDFERGVDSCSKAISALAR